jgi:hypothetical protein
MKEEDLVRFLKGKYELEDVVCYMLRDQRLLEITFKDEDAMREFTKDFRYAKKIMMIEGLKLTMPRDDFESILLVTLVTVLYTDIFWGQYEEEGERKNDRKE